METKATGAQDSVSGLRIAAKRLQGVWGVVRRSPHVALIPGLLGALLIGLGVWGVLAGSQATADIARDRAHQLLESATNSLKLDLERAVQPLLQVGDLVSNTLNHSAILEQWPQHMSAWYPNMFDDQVLGAASLGMSYAPQGKFAAIWPYDPEIWAFLSTWDLLGPTLAPFQREAVLYGLRYPNTVNCAGPDVEYAQDGTPTAYTASFVLPIFIRGAAEDEWWGMPPSVRPYDCPPSLCFFQDGNTTMKWWGNVGVTFDAKYWLEHAEGLLDLRAAGFNVQLWRAGYGTGTQVVVAPSGIALAQPSDAVRSSITMTGKVVLDWEIYVWPQSSHGWSPVWTGPLIAVVVVCSLATAGLVFAMLLSWEEHKVLLQSVLSKTAIQKLRQDMDWGNICRKQQDAMFDGIELDTPAAQMLSIIKTVLEGGTPPAATLVAVQQALQRSADVYRPAMQDLRARIKEASYIDDEVQQALMRQLVGIRSDMFHSRSTGNLGPTQSTGNLGPINLNDLVGDSTRLDSVRLQAEDSTCVPLSARASSSQLLAAKQSEEPFPADLHAALARVMQPQHRRSTVRVKSALPASLDPEGHIKAVLADGMTAMSSPASLDGSTIIAMPMDRPFFDELDKCLATSLSWEFNAFQLEQLSQGRPLSVLAFWLLHTSGLMSWARMDGAVLARFLQAVEDGYPTNPYHNARHAADVLQSMHMLLTHGGLVPHYADQLTELACLLAAIVHDLGHRGRTNDFLVNAQDDLAVLYSDRSPMENHHLAYCWSLLRRPDLNCLAGLAKPQWEKLRKLVIDLVLATDMKQHFAIMGQFSSISRGAPADSTDAALCTSQSFRTSQQTPTSPPQPATENERQLSLSMALKCADLGHLAAPLPVHLRWVSALEQEMFLQGDAEKARGLPISPLCDRTKEGITKSQVGFFDFVVLPVYRSFAQHFAGTRPMLKAVRDNFTYWQQQAAAAANRFA